jgi:chaperonin GroEL
MENASTSGEMIVEKVLEAKKKNAGYNLNTNKIVDMIKAGILDTTKVEIMALQNAASVASLILKGAVSISENVAK